MPYVPGHEEDGFLKKLDITPSDIEPKADLCTKVRGKFSLKTTNKNNAVQWVWISHLLMTIFCFQLTYGSIAIGRSLFGTRKPNPIVRPIRRRQLVRVTKEQTSTRFKNGSSEQSGYDSCPNWLCRVWLTCGVWMSQGACDWVCDEKSSFF